MVSDARMLDPKKKSAGLTGQTFARLQERIGKGEGDQGGDGENEEREELALIID